MEDGPKTELKSPVEEEESIEESFGPKRSTKEEEDEPLVTFFVDSIYVKIN